MPRRRALDPPRPRSEVPQPPPRNCLAQETPFMLTTRGWWFLLIVSTLVALGILLRQNTLALIGLTLLLWFGWEALSFASRVRFTTGRFTVLRELRNERGPVATLWA